MGFGSYRLLKPVKRRLKPYKQAATLSLDLCDNNIAKYFSYLSRYIELYKTRGFLPEEATKLGLLNFDGRIEEHFVSKSRMVARQKVLNPPSFQDITEDKAVFYSFCAKIGVPTPKLLALFLKDSSGLHWGYEPLFGEDRWAKFFENNCPDEFVIKPSKGVYGDGIVFVEKAKTGISGKKLFQELINHEKYDSFVVQECLYNHPDIMEINPKKGLQTLRIITYIDKNLKVHVVHAFFKLIVNDNRIDNHKSGTTGNLLCRINLNDGTLDVPLLITKHGPVAVPNHPETNKPIKGVVLPHWKEAFDFAKKVAPHFLPMRSIGWDVAISNDGIRIIEGNARWDPPLFGCFGENESVFLSDL